jgi:predicted dehydrogenase/threonine dehydrogenase-like Zn-dependent dehydrogenase
MEILWAFYRRFFQRNAEPVKPMKQIIQSYKNGQIQLMDVPPPALGRGSILVHNLCSLVSVGTEKYMVEMAQKSLLGKALARPDLVKQVMAKVKTDGVLEAHRIAMARLDSPTPLGYSCAGTVLEVGEGVEGFRRGDRVACAGSGYASHAEIVRVPRNLAVKIPEGVGLDSACFVALGGIALEAMRLARVSLGETVVVLGLGLLGQIAVQLLRGAGCHVLAMDVQPQKAEMARHHGAEAVATEYSRLGVLCRERTANQGADAVMIFAATPSNEPLEQAAELCRERGRVVAAGLVGLEVPRKTFYEKELEFVVSRAWGPGVYDPLYTEKGVDYPLAYARWTAGRNMEEFLSQMARGAVRVDTLITHRFPIDRSLEAYEMILQGREPCIGVLLTYSGELEPGRRIDLAIAAPGPGEKNQPSGRADRVLPPPLGIGLIGAGQFAANTILPAMKGVRGLRLCGVATSTGSHARHAAEKFGFDFCTTDYEEILRHPAVDLVFILTRHGSHARLVNEALRSGKHVFVEKPLCLNEEELKEIIQTYNSKLETQNPKLVLMVGFNRRFALLARWLKEQFQDPAQPVSVHYTVNAGVVPPRHWVQDPEEGGGRIIGEVCHFIDFIQYLTDSVPARVYAEALGPGHHGGSENIMVNLKMANGAIGSIAYLSSGDRRYPKERVEVFGGGAVGVIENFKEASFTHGGRVRRAKRWFRADRGHRAEMEALVKSVIDKGPAPVRFEEYLCTTQATLAVGESLREGRPVEVHLPDPSRDFIGTQISTDYKFAKDLKTKDLMGRG